ncbi:MAG: PilN domain-containing protein [bacterium]
MFTKTATGIDLAEDGSLRVVELEANLKGVALARAAGFQGKSDDPVRSWKEAVHEASEAGYSFANVVIGIPAFLTYQKSLSLPFHSRRKVLQVLGSELEGEIPISIDETLADYVVSESGKDGMQAIAVACRQDTVKEVLNILPEGASLLALQTDLVGFASASIYGGINNGVAVYCGRDGIMIVGISSGRPATLRKKRYTGSSIDDVMMITGEIVGMVEAEDEVLLACGDLNEPIIASLSREKITGIRTPGDWEIFTGSESEAINDPGRYLPSLGLALRGIGRREAPPFDLCQGPFRPAGRMGELRTPVIRTAALFSLIVLLGIGNLVIGYSSAKSRYDKYSQSLRSEFTELFPGTRVVSEMPQLQEKFARLERRSDDLIAYSGSGAGTLAVLGELSRIVPEGLALKINELSIDSRRLRIQGTVPSFDAVEKIKVAMEGSSRFGDVKVQNARVGADASKVSFRMQMEVK